MNYNLVVLAGHLTRQPELRHTQSGVAVAKFGLAINDTFSKDKNKVCFVDLTAFGKTAEMIAQYFDKGSPIHVQGYLEFQSWEAEDGKKSKLGVVVQHFQFVGKKAEDAPEKPARKRTSQSVGHPDQGRGPEGDPDFNDFGDIPF